MKLRLNGVTIREFQPSGNWSQARTSRLADTIERHLPPATWERRGVAAWLARAVAKENCIAAVRGAHQIEKD